MTVQVDAITNLSNFRENRGQKYDPERLRANILSEFHRCDHMSQEIIISLTTIPPRIHMIEPVIQSLLHQTVRPTRIELNVPIQYRNPKYQNEFRINVHQSVDVVRCETDWGPATKLLPTLIRYRDQDVVIIYVDDDRIYRNDLVEKLVHSGREHPHAAISAHTVSVKRQLIEAFWRARPLQYKLQRIGTMGMWNPKRRTDEEPDRIAEGFGGVLVKPSFFDQRVFECPDRFTSVDDVWISGCLTAMGHAPVGCKSACPSTMPNIQNSIDAGHLDGLSTNTHAGMNRFEANAACIEYMQDEFGIWRGI